MQTASDTVHQESDWQHAIALSELPTGAARKVRIAGKQIALFHTDDGIRACDNRCPHEGYPLSEGDVAGCTLTCNWHNWKFDLDSGANLYGGDRLRTYPVEIRGNDIWVDITEPPFELRQAETIANLQDAFDDYEYDRIAREIARLIRIGADPLDALRCAIEWSWNRMEFGWTHAYAGMADWLTLYAERSGDEEAQLVCLVESVAHTAYDVLREPEYPFEADTEAWDEETFVAAVESEDQSRAVALLRGGISDGLGFEDFERGLTRAALAHYNDFGHSLIYVTKCRELVDRLGHSVLEPLVLSLARAIIFATREDRIPEFRRYAVELSRWGDSAGDADVSAETFWRRGINKSLAAAVDCSNRDPGEVHRALLVANSRHMLAFDRAQEDRIHVTVSGNVGWLDFTHALTFGSAVRLQCEKYPELWPQGLLQMACFNGRNAAFTKDELDPDRWLDGDASAQMADMIENVLDHGQSEHIVAVHLIKTLLAVRMEMEHAEAEDGAWLLASVTRFLRSPIRRRQPRRTAWQSLQFVSRE